MNILKNINFRLPIIEKSKEVIVSTNEGLKKKVHTLGVNVNSAKTKTKNEIYKTVRNIYNKTSNLSIIGRKTTVELADSIMDTINEEFDITNSFTREDLIGVLESLDDFKTPSGDAIRLINIIYTELKKCKFYKKDEELKLYARFASYVYGTKKSSLIPKDWEIISHVDGVKFNDEQTGLKSMLFHKTDSDLYVYALAGTRNAKDWGHNIK